VALWSNSWTWQSLFHCHVTALTHISVHVIKQCNVVLTNRQWCCAAGNVTPLLWGQQTFCTEIVHCFHGPSGVLFIRPYLVEHSSSLATALITDTRTVQVFALGVIVCVIVTARASVTVLCYLCVLKWLFIIIIVINCCPGGKYRQVYVYDLP